MSGKKAKGSNFGVSINRSCKGELQNATLFRFMRSILDDVVRELSQRCRDNGTPFIELVESCIRLASGVDGDASICRKVVKYFTALSVFERNHKKKTRHVSVDDFAGVIQASTRYVVSVVSEEDAKRVDVTAFTTNELVDEWGGVLSHGYPHLMHSILKLYESVFDETKYFLSCVTLSSAAFFAE